MSSSLGRVIARLAEPTEALPPDLVALINQNVKPPTPVTADDVYVRAMYIVSDQVNSFGGRFPVDEHARANRGVGHAVDQDEGAGVAVLAVTIHRQRPAGLETDERLLVDV